MSHLGFHPVCGVTRLALQKGSQRSGTGLVLPPTILGPLTVERKTVVVFRPAQSMSICEFNSRGPIQPVAPAGSTGYHPGRICAIPIRWAVCFGFEYPQRSEGSSRRFTPLPSGLIERQDANGPSILFSDSRFPEP